MTSLFSFPLYPAPKAWDFCMSRVQCEGKKKVAWLVRLAGGWRAPALWFSCWSGLPVQPLERRKVVFLSLHALG